MGRITQRWLAIPLLVAGLFVFSSRSSADVQDYIKRAQAFEQAKDWDKACEMYEAILRLDRAAPGVQARYQNSLRRYWQARRHKDDSFRKEVLSLDYAQAIKLYTQVRDTLLDSSLDKKKLDPARLFKKGLEEFDHALGDPFFRQQYIPDAKDAEIESFRADMKKAWATVMPNTRRQAINQLREIALAAQSRLELSSTVAIMEFACGACYAVDDYSVYLTPLQLRELCDSLRGELGDVGLSFILRDGQLVVDQIEMMGPAGKAQPSLTRGDLVISIANKPAAMMTVDQAHALLQGPVGSTIEIEIYKPNMEWKVKLQRQALSLASVPLVQMWPKNVGYMKITGFQDSTVQEVDSALASLGKSNMKVLVLDLRGNSGGLFESAVEVATRFIASGIITTRTSIHDTDPKKAKDFNKVFASNNPQALTLPLVVLVDSETASAAEVLAGALKDHKRGRLIGQTTFGKGCTQCLVALPTSQGNTPTGGLRLTVARFYSPDGLPYTGRGIPPDIFSAAEQQDQAALAEAQRLLEN